MGVEEAPPDLPVIPEAFSVLKLARKIVVFAVGVTVVLVGVVMVITPGPAILVVPAGLAILATEFLWARRLLCKFREQIDALSKAAKKKPPVK